MSADLCDLCGTPLVPGVGPEAGVSIDTTGETICGDCFMDILDSFTSPLASDSDTQAFVQRVGSELAERTGTPLARYTIGVKFFMSHDVEIRLSNDGHYKIDLLIDLQFDPHRYERARDYLVQWIIANPTPGDAWTTLTSPNQVLTGPGYFVFIFLPADYPSPPITLADIASRQIAGAPVGYDVGWMVCPVAPSDATLRARQIQRALRSWSETQFDPDTLQFSVQNVKFRFSEEPCMCVVVQRSS